MNLGRLLLLLLIGYVIVTWIGIGQTIFNIKVLHMKSMKESPGMGEGYEKTKPWHPLYNIVIFSLLGCVYMRGLEAQTLSAALIAGAIWAIICIVVDLVGWVLIKHPWRLTFKEFYVDYQPWITLIYIAIFLGPVIGYLIVR
ncbi:hypothetical protein SAMN04487831_103189 [Pseudobutyrivibrio sp. UC1225]|uniref:hypothetical protein n=1 Tax=Pseudobutyrivibrio sp. UC1225 TaxID=1798185 RepID=UPI0008E126C1|nr:hypothetical protein [Pseudobutyrivibrio sp. UC1225]SFN76024.1 hypothetical protein SAMN04487831_103189 [Pseudobutyrivibrio sp. UC1225]